MKHFITTSDYTAEELGRMIDLAIDLKRKKKKKVKDHYLSLLHQKKL